MELSVPINDVNIQNVFFGEKRKNIIVDGDFIKIIYSTDSFEMNGLFIFIEFEPLIKEKEKEKEKYDELIGTDYGIRRVTSNHFTFDTNQYYNMKATDINNSPSCSVPGLPNEWTKITNKSSIAALKRNISFNISSKENLGLITRLCQIESEIVNRYIANNCPGKVASYGLRTQLLSGTIKYHSENIVIEGLRQKRGNLIDRRCKSLDNMVQITPPPGFLEQDIIAISNSYSHYVENLNLREKRGNHHSFYEAKDKCILKISGIWETSSQVGITIKFILLHSAA